ncbi:MAG: hypothetical protein CSA09_01090 [Candidatus Contendobacter odensis]|uniref:Core-binding (CB) domain-containing protein n=1 Tax=Candidatus Contendibacter odensensis TaxID=1400860 RepID=A0A2G6PGW1_9GAMM|nr:MAG: hypothetical protein CSA09_01090 [Candidatus Contendobacter odensis]
MPGGTCALKAAHNTANKYSLYLLRLSQWLNTQPFTLLTATPESLETYGGLYLYQQGLKPQSRRVVIAAIRNFYQWATEKAGLLSENPARALENPPGLAWHCLVPRN